MKQIILLEPGYAYGRKTHHVACHVILRRPLGGFDEFGVISAHWANDMAKKQQQSDLAVADLVRLIRAHNIRFVVGVFNMQNYRVSALLNEAGVENHMLAFHAAKKPSSDELHFDSCAIVAIGSMRYNPKLNLLSTHVLMGAQSPPKTDGNATRGFPADTYGKYGGIPYALPALAAYLAEPLNASELELMRKTTALRQSIKAGARDTEKEQQLEDCYVQLRATFGEELVSEDGFVHLNARVEVDREWKAIRAGEAEFDVTKDMPPIQDVKCFMARPWFWDPAGKQWGAVAHWPLMASVGAKRARTAVAKAKRSARPQAQYAIAKARAKTR